jgi:orotidine-5'-phosphate decarboxylase
MDFRLGRHLGRPFMDGAMGFFHKLARAAERNDSLLCVGLDPDPERLPSAAKDVAAFQRAIIDATCDLVCAYKPNLAFYEAMGEAGLGALRGTLAAIPADVPVIADAKRGDVGHTARAYARALFDYWGFDAVTVNPYLGADSLEPFLEREDRGVFLLCRTSNPGARDLQDLPVLLGEGGGQAGSAQPFDGSRTRPLFEVVAERAKEWNTRGNAGLVVGATYPEELGRLREICPEMTFLVPGVGAQGGDLEACLRLGLNAEGGGLIINVSRQVLYASRGEDFAAAARQVALALRDEMHRLREVVVAGRTSHGSRVSP